MTPVFLVPASLLRWKQGTNMCPASSEAGKQALLCLAVPCFAGSRAQQGTARHSKAQQGTASST